MKYDGVEILLKMAIDDDRNERHDMRIFNTGARFSESEIYGESTPQNDAESDDGDNCVCGDCGLPCSLPKWRYESHSTEEDTVENLAVRIVKLIATWQDGEGMSSKTFLVHDYALMAHSNAFKAILMNPISKDEDDVTPSIEIEAPHDVTKFFVDWLLHPNETININWTMMMLSDFFPHLLEFLHKYECVALMKLIENQMKVVDPTSRFVRLAVKYEFIDLIKSWDKEIVEGMVRGHFTSEFFESSITKRDTVALSIEEFPPTILRMLFYTSLQVISEFMVKQRLKGYQH